MQPVCIEFVDTVEPRVGPVERDALAGYTGLVGWARRIGLAVPRQVSGEHAEQAFKSAIELREALFVLLLALTNRAPPPREAVAVLRRHYVAACASAQLEITTGAATWHWSPDEVEQISQQVAVDAMALVNSPAAARLKQCPRSAGGCGWLFVDTTKNGSRRWCSLAGCGGTVKARRQAAKRKAARSGRVE